jgi:hypothetical protein
MLLLNRDFLSAFVNRISKKLNFIFYHHKITQLKEINPMSNRINSRKAELSETLMGLVSIANSIINISPCIIAPTGLCGVIRY